jgi:uncharacterized cupredoxin-like copper-binding protein
MNGLRFAGLLAAVALATAACTTTGSSSEATASGTASSGTRVAVTVQEFSLSADPASAPAGSVTFQVTNNGPDFVHEFVVVRTDLAPDALPTSDDGSFNEDGEGVEVVDEIDDVDVGATEELSLDLDAGAYVLLCNKVAGTVSHFAMGMRTAFTVE